MSVWDTTAVFLVVVIMVIVGVLTATLVHATAPAINNVLSGQGLKNYNYIITFIPQMDYVFVFIFLGLNIAVLLRAAFLNSDPTNYAIAWFMSLFIVFISFYISNVFSQVFETAAFATGISWFQNSIYIVRNFPVFNALFLILYSVIIVSKLRSGNQGV